MITNLNIANVQFGLAAVYCCGATRVDGGEERKNELNFDGLKVQQVRPLQSPITSRRVALCSIRRTRNYHGSCNKEEALGLCEGRVCRLREVLPPPPLFVWTIN